MRAEFNFIIKTGKPSLEYDVCRTIDDFKHMLVNKCGQEIAPQPIGGGIWNKMVNIFSSSTEEVKEHSKKADTSMQEDRERELQPKSGDGIWNEVKGKPMTKRQREDAWKKE